MTSTSDGFANFDPVTLEILWSRLISIADESAAALLRTSFSTIVRESNDYATGLMDVNGESLAENTAGIPSFVGILPRTLKHFLARFPKETWRPGDCVITNDPWMGTGHLPDFTLAARAGLPRTIRGSRRTTWRRRCRASAPSNRRSPPDCPCGRSVPPT